MDDLPFYSVFRNFEVSEKIPRREDIYGSGPPSDMISEESLEYVKKYAGRRVLDIGCGIGAYVKALLRLGYHCEGIEGNPDYVSECVKNGLPVSHMDAQKLAFPVNSFDTAVMIEVLEHLPEPTIALEESFRVARMNVVVSVPNIDVLPIMSKYQVAPWHMLAANHLNFFTPRILGSLLRQFTDELEVFTYGRFAPWITERDMHMHIFGVAWK